MRDSEKFVIRINIEGDKNSNGYPSYKTKIERAIEVAATSPSKIDEAVAAMTKATTIELIEELIRRDEQAEKEPEE